MTLDDVKAAVNAAGFCFGGAFHSGPDDLPAGEPSGSIVMLAFGAKEWPAFSGAPEFADGKAHPLDRWSYRVVTDLARELGARAYFPFTAPLMPFMRWAQKAEPVAPSEIGMLIHPTYGLWRAWRGALAFAEKIELPDKVDRARPCDSCSDKPCLAACPVSAMKGGGVYDVPVCGGHLRRSEGADCMARGCLARRACPVGVKHQYSRDQAAFHMTSFRGG